ncbi:MAG: RidA family protein [Opitutales bacterium]|nr:RidA family protein [Opitutales bacterium]NRA25628.1 RidA family protein [Opitutales bacterium]
MSYEAKISELGLTLPGKPAPGGNYISATRVGNLVYTAGAICVVDGKFTHLGQVGAERTIEEGYEGAKVCALNLLAAIKGEIGSLEKIARFISVSGYVNGISGFSESPAVINGASDLLVEVFGDAGRHVRAAVTVAGLPKNSTVEIQCVVEVKD